MGTKNNLFTPIYFLLHLNIFFPARTQKLVRGSKKKETLFWNHHASQRAILGLPMTMLSRRHAHAPGAVLCSSLYSSVIAFKLYTKTSA